MDFHVSDMKPFVLDSAVVDPMDVARRDYMEYSNTWEPYKNLRQCGPLHGYLAENNLAKLIPPQFR